MSTKDISYLFPATSVIIYGINACRGRALPLYISAINMATPK